MRRVISLRRLAVTALLVHLLAPAAPAQAPDRSQPLESIRAYISDGWNKLSRSLTDCATYADPKLATAPQLYLPFGMPESDTVKTLETRCGVHVANLPENASHIGLPGVSSLQPPGLLYLEHPYVVPGGRFNEMYGWDSYFILLGLIRDHRLDLAQSMVDNFLFEVDHYGAVLNANRTYYLTRSQPPFLTSMILALYAAENAAGHGDAAWLAKAYALAVEDHDFWTVAPHLAGSTGLSRYYDFGEGPAAESVQDETGHYRDVAAYFLARPQIGADLIALAPPDQAISSAPGKTFSLEACDSSLPSSAPRCVGAASLALASDFYKGDRSMRESGFDVSFRFGAYGARTHHFAPVCLNSLLYKSEKDLQTISAMLGRSGDAAKWKHLAEQRRANIQRYLWDAERGMFFDYDFEKQKRSDYEYVTTFYPLWAGLATPQQAQALAQHIHDFERPGGLVMSPYETGAQWDLPYAWAPNQLLAGEGLRRHGFAQDADRLSYEFLSMVAENFRRDGFLVEKYNAVTRSTEVRVTAGYQVNVIGFGWTNGVFLELLGQLPPDLVHKLDLEQNAAVVPPDPSNENAKAAATKR